MISCIRRNVIVHVSGIVARWFFWYLKLSICQEEASIGPNTVETTILGWKGKHLWRKQTAFTTST